MCRNFLFFSIFLLLLFVHSSSKERNLKDQFQLEGLQEGRTRRMIWLDKRRRLILPPDSSLSITPILAFPLLKQSSTWVTFENFQLQWTFWILFTGLGWTSEDNAWPVDISFLIPNMTSSDTEENASIPKNRGRKGQAKGQEEHCLKQRHGSRMCHDKIPIMALPTNIPGGERASIFPKLERFLESFGISGRPCLQRAVCEVHEIPLKNGFGMLGELLTMFFTISRSTYSESHMPGYLRAELAGKFGDCSEYHRRCPYSIFTSKK